MKYSKYLQGEYFPNFVVIVERLKNDINGNARYHATVIPKDSGDQNYHSTPRYTIKSCGTERQVAEQAIELYLKDIKS